MSNRRSFAVGAVLACLLLASCSGGRLALRARSRSRSAWRSRRSRPSTGSPASTRSRRSSRSATSTMLEAVADDDANRQLEQVSNFIARGVDGIIIAPKDAKTVIPMIKAANRANIPIVLYNRPPADDAGKCVTVVADNLAITKETVAYMAEQAQGGRQEAQGDDPDRRPGRPATPSAAATGSTTRSRSTRDAIEVVAEIPTEWNQEKALAGVTNALQAHPDINFIFTSSDFLFPSLVSALKSAGQVQEDRRGGPRPARRVRRRRDRLPDARRRLPRRRRRAGRRTSRASRSVQAVLDLMAGKDVPADHPGPRVRDPPGQPRRRWRRGCGAPTSRTK